MELNFSKIRSTAGPCSTFTKGALRLRIIDKNWGMAGGYTFLCFILIHNLLIKLVKVSALPTCAMQRAKWR